MSIVQPNKRARAADLRNFLPTSPAVQLATEQQLAAIAAPAHVDTK